MTKTTKTAAPKKPIQKKGPPLPSAAKAKRPHGGKPGSAMSSQSAVYADPADITGKAASRAKGTPITAPKVAGKPDAIKAVKPVTSGGDYVVVESNGGKSEAIHRGRITGELAKLAVVGGSLKAVQNWLKANKPEAKLATGLTSRIAPQSAMAAAESRKPAKAAPAAAKAAAPAPAAKPAKAAAKLPRKAASRADRTYKATDKPDTSKAGSFRTYMISTIRAHKTTEAAKAAHAKSGQFAHERLNFNWAAQHGYIAFTD